MVVSLLLVIKAAFISNRTHYGKVLAYFNQENSALLTGRTVLYSVMELEQPVLHLILVPKKCVIQNLGVSYPIILSYTKVLVSNKR